MWIGIPIVFTFQRGTGETIFYHVVRQDCDAVISQLFQCFRCKITVGIKKYRSKSKSLSSGQVLMRDYHFNEGIIIAKEMMNQLCLDMVSKKLATQSVSLYVGYSHTQAVGGAKGTAQLAAETNADSIIVPAIATLYKRIVNPAYPIRRVCLCCNNVVKDQGVLQLNMFEDISSQLKNKALQETMLGIKAKYGKNAILKGINYDPAATGRERNMQIGGHKSNG